MKINEIQPGAGIEIKAKIIEIQPIRKTWECFECETRGVWLKEEEFKKTCPNCNAVETKQKKKGLYIQRVTSLKLEDDTGSIYLDIWNKDIDKHTVGDRIHLINGYAKKYEEFGLKISKGKFGSILNEKS